jgi:hypothetical protein
VPSYTAGGGTSGLASVDAVQEFTIQTSTYAAEYGRQPGAQLAIVTRSGANQVHGSADDARIPALPMRIRGSHPHRGVSGWERYANTRWPPARPAGRIPGFADTPAPLR